MSTILSNLVPIFIAFIAGLNHSVCLKKINTMLINRLTNVCLFSLLFLMGVTIGSLPGILGQIAKLGLIALGLALSTSLFIAIPLFLLKMKTKSPLASDGAPHTQFHFLEYIKDPLMLIGVVICGFLFSFFAHISKLDLARPISLFLYIMIFFIGIKLSLANIRIRSVLLNKNNLILVFCTVTFCYVGAIFASLFVPLTLKECLSICSGFGWYTLSGILFTHMGSPFVGSIAFLCDLFRELLALLLLPTLSRLGKGYAGIGIAGATAMDVTLPIIEKYAGTDFVPVAFISGGILTILVPILIPLFYSLPFSL